MNVSAAVRPRGGSRWSLIFAIAILVAVATGSGCTRRAAERTDIGAAPPIATNVYEKGAFANGIDRLVSPASTSTGGTIEMYRFDSGEFQFGVAATSARLGMGEWSRALPDASAAINGGYFMDDGMPSGFLSIDGRRVGNGSFDADKSAMIDFEDRVRIISATATEIDASVFKTALQTYPWLVKNGVSAVREESGKRARRSFIGIDKSGAVWLGVVADAEISLFELSRRLPAIGIDWSDVVNLDGGPSTGIFVGSETDRVMHETFGGVPNVVYVVRKAKS
jgi:exopolysaccharide biosynthesis protein